MASEMLPHGPFACLFVVLWVSLVRLFHSHPLTSSTCCILSRVIPKTLSGTRPPSHSPTYPHSLPLRVRAPFTVLPLGPPSSIHHPNHASFLHSQPRVILRAAITHKCTALLSDTSLHMLEYSLVQHVAHTKQANSWFRKVPFVCHMYVLLVDFIQFSACVQETTRNSNCLSWKCRH